MIYRSEHWKSIEEFEGSYQCSTLGRIRRIGYSKQMRNGKLRYYKAKILHLRFDSAGHYLLVDLGFGKERKTFLVHRLIAQTFLGDTKDMQVNHINGIKQDNRILNLEICTHSQNMLHAYNSLNIKKSALGKTGALHPRSKPLLQIKCGVVVGEYDSINTVTRLFGYDASTIVKCCKGKLGICYGFEWRYK